MSSTSDVHPALPPEPPKTPSAENISEADLQLDLPVTRGQFFAAAERMGDKLEEELQRGLDGLAARTSTAVADHAAHLAKMREELRILDRRVWVSLQINVMLLLGEVKLPLKQEDLPAFLDGLSEEYDRQVAESGPAQKGQPHAEG